MGRFRHAAALCNGEKHMQVAQLDSPSDPVVPAHVQSTLGKFANTMQ
jgi:hypothetical protein